MMVPATIDATDVLGATQPAGVPIVAGGPDFAAMIATAGQGLVQSSATSIEDLSNPANAGEFAKGHTKVTPRSFAVAEKTGAAFEMPSSSGIDANMSRNGTYLQVDVDTVGAGAPVTMLAGIQPKCGAEAPTKVASNVSTVTPVDAMPKAAEAEKPKKAVVDDPAILVADLPVAVATAPQPNDVPPPVSKPKRVDATVVTSVASKPVAAPPPTVLEARGSVVERKVDLPDPAVVVPGEMRIPAQIVPILEKPVSSIPDRVPVFAVHIADVARDVLSLTKDKDVRFNVQPETLGPVSVTIERGEAGLGLRLGVETLAAVQAVRQAEPMLNDGRSHAPFAHVSVDLNSPDTRGRSARATPLVRRTRGDDREIMLQPAPVTTGRYA